MPQHVAFIVGLKLHHTFSSSQICSTFTLFNRPHVHWSTARKKKTRMLPCANSPPAFVRQCREAFNMLMRIFGNHNHNHNRKPHCITTTLGTAQPTAMALAALLTHIVKTTPPV
jgi:hypothetical protein